MQRYFLSSTYHQLPQATDILMEAEHIHHMLNVMRMKPKDRCVLVFKDSVAIEAEITSIVNNQVYLRETAKEMVHHELPVSVTIASGLPKGDKLEWIMQKGTELGATGFIAYPTARSVVRWDAKKRQKKQERLQRIIREAAEQSERQILPTVKLLANEQELTALFQHYTHVLIAYEESGREAERDNLVKTLQQSQKGDSILLLFGSEGGFAKEEIERYCKAGGICCGLGPRILRAETAPLYVLGACSYQWELLQDGC